MNTLHTLLRGLPAFERFSERQLDALISQLVVEQHPTGTMLIEAGTPGRALFLIMEGVVGVTPFERKLGDESSADDLVQMRVGEVVGRLSLVEGMPSPVSCHAVGDVMVAALTPARYHALSLLAPAIAHQFQYMVATRLAQYVQSRNQKLRERLGARAPVAAPSLLQRLFGV
jgi:signal-transduction protein with cAMP-binding, CBS, and nucleotidyltransferase domain